MPTSDQKNEKISDIEGWIENAKGKTIRTLQRREIQESAADLEETFYDDYLSIKFSLKHNEYPYFICYSYTTTEPVFFIIAGWTPVFARDIPTRKATLTLTVPTGYQIFSDTSGIRHMDVSEQKESEVYTWESSYEKPVKSEIYAPEISSFQPYVRIVPRKFFYGVEGSYDTWTDYGEWYSKLISGLDKLPAEEETKINEMIKNAGTTDEKIRIIYHYIQDNTRYINVSTKIGGMKPFPAKYVSINKYGDCKALVNYTKSLLEAAGIKSYYTLVYAGDTPADPLKGMPFPGFNHVILMVPDGKDTIWLECTSKISPFNYLGSFTSGRRAFVINNEKSGFVWTQRPEYEKLETVKTFNFRTDPISGLVGDAVFTMRGEQFEHYLALKNNLDKKEQSLLLNKIFSYSGLDVSEYDLSAESRDSDEITLSMHGKAGKYLKKVQNDIAVNIAHFQIPDFEEVSRRKLPVKITNPVAERDTVYLELNDLQKTLFLPKDLEIANKYGFYRISTSQTGNKITLIKEFCILQGEYSLKEYPSFYSFIADIKKEEKICGIVFTNKTL